MPRRAAGRAAPPTRSFSDSAPADRDVVHLVHRRGVRRRRGREQVRLHDVVDVAEVARRLAVAVDRRPARRAASRDPARNHRRVRALRILPRAEHVEVAQPDASRCRSSGRTRRRRARSTYLVTAYGESGRPIWSSTLGSAGMVAVGRARRRVDEARDAGVARGDQHVEEAGRVRRVRARADPRSSAAPSRAPPGAARRRRLRTPRRQASRSTMSPSTKRCRCHAAVADRVAHLVEVAAVTRSRSCRGPRPPGPARAASRRRCEPMKPALPVTSQRRGRAAQRRCASRQTLGDAANRSCHQSLQTRDAARAQRRGVGLALHVDVQRRSGTSFADEVVERALPGTRGARPRRRSRRRAAARPRASSSTPYSCRASRGVGDRIVHVHVGAVGLAARGSTSITRELRRSGQFSLNVSPSTLTCAPLHRDAGLDHAASPSARRRTCPCRR